MRITSSAFLPAFVFAFAALYAVAAPGATPESRASVPPAAAAPASPPPAPAAPAALPLPSPPAFFAGGVSRIRGIEGDNFSVECDDRRILTIRLADADCRAFGPDALANAKSVATTLLQGGAFWVFPCGQAKGASGEEIWGDVWTTKGWLSDILIRAGYAKRRPEADLAALTPIEKPPASAGGALPPPAPAFAAASGTSSEGDTLEVEHGGHKLKVYLSDVTCQGLDSAKRDAAAATAARLLQAGPFWVFPCTAMKGQGPDDVRGRVWTQRGWLSSALVQEGSARRLEEGEIHAPAPGARAAASGKAAAGGTGPAAANPPAARPAPKPATAPARWREIQVPEGPAMGMSCQSGRFRVEVPQWRLTWNMQPWREAMPISLSVCRVDEKVINGATSTHVGSFRGLTGSTIIRAAPGTFWIQVTGSGKLGVKVEVPE